MKSFLFLFFSVFLALHALAQNDTDSSLKEKPAQDTHKVAGTKPTVPAVKRTPIKSLPTVNKLPVEIKPDTIGAISITHPAPAVKDTLEKPKQVPEVPEKEKLPYLTVLRDHPYYNFLGEARLRLSYKKVDPVHDGLFYLLTGVVFYFAIVRLLFGKYLKNLFAVFFRVSLKQKQIREQLLQSPLPSLLLNIFFVISGGIYISFLMGYYKFMAANNLWMLIVFSTVALGVIYLGKFMLLKLMGWIFNISEATNTYNFVVFLVNKLLGIFLLPFLVLLAFSDDDVVDILVTLSFTMIAIFFAYRYIISYSPVRKEIKVSQFHFFLYLCAFEIAPLLLIYKLLLTFLERST